MTTAMLNVRMPEEMKAAGDEVLRSHGVSTTEAIRKFYEQLGRTQEIPTWLKSSAGNEAEQKRKLLKNVVGMAPLEQGQTLEDLKRERLLNKV